MNPSYTRVSSLGLRAALAISLFAGAAPWSLAHAPGGFEPVVALVTRYNSALPADSAQMAAEIHEARAENMLADPELEGELLFPQKGGEKRWSAGVSQSFDWPGLYRARGRVTRAMASLAEAEYGELLHDARYDTRRMLIELVGANREAAMLGELSQTMDTLLARYVRAREKGEATILDVNKLRVEAARARARHQAAEGEAARIYHQVFSAVPADERPPRARFTEYPLWELEPFEEYIEEAMECSHARIIEARGELARARAGVASASRYPSFSLGYTHAFEEGTHYNGFSIGIGLPIYSRRHSAAAARAGLLSEEYRSLQLMNELESELRSDYIAALSLRSQLDAMGPAVESADNMRLLRRALHGGELSLLEYLLEVNFFREAALEYNTLRRDYLLRVASLSRH